VSEKDIIKKFIDFKCSGCDAYGCSSNKHDKELITVIIKEYKKEVKKIIDKCEELKIWTDKDDKCPYKKKVDNSNDYVIIGITSKEDLKKKLGINDKRKAEGKS